MCSPGTCSMDSVFFFLVSHYSLACAYVHVEWEAMIEIRRPTQPPTSPVLELPADTRLDDVSPNRTVSNHDRFVSRSTAETR